MARFPFSITSRKKQTSKPPPPNAPPMSKAHKILGSTPLNIDAPGSWDDAASSMTTDDRSPITAASYSESELRGYECDHQVAIARSDQVWGEESDIIPHPLRLNAINFGDLTESGRSETTGALRKSRSSSTIRSWYDKSKLPLSISQQTSSSAIAKGLPPNLQLGLNSSTGDEGWRTKRKPAKLDLSLTTRKGSDTEATGLDTGSGFDRMLRSPSILSPFSPMSTRSRESRKIRKKRTKEELHSPIPEAPRPGTSGSNRLGPPTPSLYDHYEQMSLRHVMRQSSTPSLRMTENGILTLDNVMERPGEDQEEETRPSHRRQYHIPQTPKYTTFTKADLQTSPGDAARSVSSRHTKTSKTSKSTDRSLVGTDLLQTSVLMLSSDSEDDDNEPERPIIRSPVSAPARSPSNVEDRVPPLEECRPRAARGAKVSRKQMSQSSKQAKRTSFAASNTYITIPPPANGRETPVTIDSRSETPIGNLSQAASSSRNSATSDFSVNSGMTWQGTSGYGIQEARAITMLPARRPSNVDIGEEKEEASIANTEGSREQTLHRASSTDQLTPPLSPTSVDFYIRSAHSSVDGSGSHNRLMAVTHQEEMLLSALRRKQQTMHRTSMSQVSEGNEDEVDEGINGRFKDSRCEQQDVEDIEEIERSLSSKELATPMEEGQQKGHRSKGSQTTITGSTFDFGFPAPPSFREAASIDGEPCSGRRKSSGVLPPLQTQGLGLSDSIPPSPAGPPPKLALPELPKHVKSLKSSSSRDTVSSHSQQDVLLYLDEFEPSPDMADIQDWESATSPIAGSLTSDALLGRPWPEHNRQKANSKRARDSFATNSQSFFRANTFSRQNIEDRGDDQEEEEPAFTEAEDVPRADSPISPGAFPSVPAERTTMTNTARLSAVGPGLLSNAGELGWWGDDD